jgi:hypothetical protein
VVTGGNGKGATDGVDGWLSTAGIPQDFGMSGLVMAMISNHRRNEASILASFSISKRNEPAYSRTCKDQREAKPAYSTP